jgi:4-amino-4-deoxy-L-arabinose transferase-like glycosyltransferase
VLAVARTATLLFAAISLLYVYLLGRWAGGPIVAMLATVFFSTDPTLLAHSALATSDAAATPGFLACTYYGLRWIFAPGFRKAIASGVALGFAIGAKFSAAILIPVLILLILWRIWETRRRHAPPPARRFLSGFMTIGAASLLTIWAGYLFDIGRLADCEFITARSRIAGSPLARLKIPMPRFPLGVAVLVRHNMLGSAAYLNGRPRHGGW